MLANAGVRRCYGIVGDALNPVIDALRRHGKIEFIHVRHEEYGAFGRRRRGVPDRWSGGSVWNRRPRRRPPVQWADGCAQGGGFDHRESRARSRPASWTTATLEELNPYKFFDAASLYTGRVVNPAQARAIFNTAILTAVLEKGPTVISLPGDVASADAATRATPVTIPATPILRPADADLNQLVEMIDEARTVAIFGGEGCREARDEVIQLAGKLQAPVGYALRGKQWLEHDNPNAVGMTGLIGYGGAYRAINEAELLLLLGTDFPFSEFLPGHRVKKVQIDKRPTHIGRRTALDLGLVGDIRRPSPRCSSAFARKPIATFSTRTSRRRTRSASSCGTMSTRDLRSSRSARNSLAATLSDIASDDAMFFADTGTAVILAGTAYQRRQGSPTLRLVFLGLHGQCRAKCVRRAVGVPGPANDRAVRRRGLHDARAR